MAQFPSSWPDGCPPADSDDANGPAYRIVGGNPPSEEDFKTHDELGKAKKAKPCTRRALSVFESKETAAHCRELLPYLGDHVAYGTLNPVHGRIKLTDGTHPGHHSWWIAKGVNPQDVLTKVEPLQ